jgi:hypothetical protein
VTVFTSIRERWTRAQRAGEQKASADAGAAHKRYVAQINDLRELPDDELIAKIGPRNTFTAPHAEMEMQRRLKDAIEANTREGAAGRRAANRIGWILIVLTLVLVALTVVLIKHG